MTLGVSINLMFFSDVEIMLDLSEWYFGGLHCISIITVFRIL